MTPFWRILIAFRADIHIVMLLYTKYNSW
jgi:hypothetical protein